jgi:hypothetical protein
MTRCIVQVVDGQANLSSVLDLMNVNSVIVDFPADPLGAKIKVRNIVLHDMDSFTRFDPLSTIGNYTLHSAFALEKLSVVLELEVDLWTIAACAPGPTYELCILTQRYVSPANPDVNMDGVVDQRDIDAWRDINNDGDPDINVISDHSHLTEVVNVSMSLTNLSVDFAAMLGISEQEANALTLGQLLHSAAPCLLSTIESANITSLDVRIGYLTAPRISGFISHGIDDIFNEVVDVFFRVYEEIGLTALHNALRVKIRTDMDIMLNAYLMNATNTHCPPQHGFGVLNLEDVLGLDLVQQGRKELKSMLQSTLQTDQRDFALKLASRSDGNLTFNDAATANMLDIAFYNGSIRGLSSANATPMEVLVPTGPYSVNSSISFNRLILTGSLKVGVHAPLFGQSSTFRLGIDAANLGVWIGLDPFKVDKSLLWALTVKQLGLLSGKPVLECWLSTISEIRPEMKIMLGPSSIMYLVRQSSAMLAAKALLRDAAAAFNTILNHAMAVVTRTMTYTNLSATACPTWAAAKPSSEGKVCRVADTGTTRECAVLAQSSSTVLKMLPSDQSLHMTGADFPTLAEGRLVRTERFYNLSSAGLHGFFASVDPVAKPPKFSLHEAVNSAVQALLGNVTAGLLESSRKVQLEGSELFPSHLVDLIVHSADVVMGAVRSKLLQGPREGQNSHTLTHQISLQRVDLQVNVSVKNRVLQAADPDTCATPSNQTSHLLVQIGLLDVKLALATLVAVDRTQLETLSIGSLLNPDDGGKNAASCAFGAISALNLTFFNLTIGKFIEPTITIEGAFSPPTTLLSNVYRTVACLADPLIVTELPRIFGSAVVRELVNSFSRLMIDTFEKSCNQSSVPMLQQFGTAQEGTTTLDFQKLIKFIFANNSAALIPHPTPAVSAFAEDYGLQQFTPQIEKLLVSVQDGVKVWDVAKTLLRPMLRSIVERPAVGWPSAFPDGSTANIAHLVKIRQDRFIFDISKVNVSGLTSVTDVRLLYNDNASKPQMLKNQFVVGQSAAAPVQVSTTVRLKIDNGSSVLVELAAALLGIDMMDDTAASAHGESFPIDIFTFNASIYDGQAFVNMDLDVDLLDLAQLNLSQIVLPQCLSRPVRRMIPTFGLDNPRVHVAISCPAGCRRGSVVEALQSRLLRPSVDNQLQHVLSGTIAALSSIVSTSDIMDVRVSSLRRYSEELLNILWMDSSASGGSSIEMLRPEQQLHKNSGAATFVNFRKFALCTGRSWLPAAMNLIQRIATQQDEVYRTVIELVAPGGNWQHVLSQPLALLPTTFASPMLSLPFVRHASTFNFKRDWSWIESSATSPRFILERQQAWHLNGIRLTNLSDIGDVQFMKTIGDMTFLHGATIASIGVELNISISIQVDPAAHTCTGCSKGPCKRTTEILLQFGLKDVRAQIATMLAMDAEAFFNLTIGELLYSRDPVACAMQTVIGANLTSVDFSIGRVVSPVVRVVSGQLDFWTTRIINGFRGAESLMEPLVEGPVPHTISKLLPPLINPAIAKLLVDLHSSSCDVLPSTRVSKFVDLQSNQNLLGMLLLQTRTLTSRKLNQEIAKLTMEQSGIAGTIQAWHDTPVQFKTRSKSLLLRLSNVSIGGLNSFHPGAALLNASGPHTLLTAVILGPVNFSLQLDVNFVVPVGVGQRVQHNNRLVLSLDTDFISFEMQTLLQIVQDALQEMRLGQLTFQECWLSFVHAALLSLDLSFGVPLRLKLKCLHCDSDVLQRVDRSLADTQSGYRLGRSLNSILDIFADAIVARGGFNINQSTCQQLREDGKTIVGDVFGFSADRGVSRNDALLREKELVATAYNRTFIKFTDQPGDTSTISQMTRAGFDMVRSIAAKQIEALTQEMLGSKHQFVHAFDQPLVLHDTTPNECSASVWIQEKFEVWELHSITLTGMDDKPFTADVMDMLCTTEDHSCDGTTDHTLFHEFQIHNLTIDLNMTVQTLVHPIAGSCSTRVENTERVFFRTGVESMHVGIATLLMIDVDKLQNLELGSMLNHSIGCLLDSVYRAEITTANVTIGNFMPSSLAGFSRSFGMDSLVLSMLGPTLCLASPLLSELAVGTLGASNGSFNIRNILNSELNAYIASNSQCERPSSNGQPFIDFTKFMFTIPSQVCGILDSMDLPSMLQCGTDNGLKALFEYVHSAMDYFVSTREVNQMIEDDIDAINGTLQMQGYDNLSCIFDSNAQQKLYGSTGKSCLIKRERWDADASCADTDAVVGDATYSKCKPFCCIEVAPGRPDMCVKLAPMEKCSNTKSPVPSIRTQQLSLAGQQLSFEQACPTACGVKAGDCREATKIDQPSTPGGFLTGFETTIADDPDKELCITCGVIGHISFSVKNVFVSGLTGIVSAVDLLDPVAMQMLNSSAALFDSAPATISLKVHLAITGMKMDNTVTLAFSVRNVSAALKILLQVYQDNLLHMTMGTLSEAPLSCLLHTVGQAYPALIEIDLGRVGLTLMCHECTSPLLIKMQEATHGAQSERNMQEFTRGMNRFINRWAERYTIDSDPSTQDATMVDMYESVVNKEHAATVCLGLTPENKGSQKETAGALLGALTFAYNKSLQVRSSLLLPARIVVALQIAIFLHNTAGCS